MSSTIVTSLLLDAERDCPQCTHALEIHEVRSTVGVELVPDGYALGVCCECKRMWVMNNEAVWPNAQAFAR